jgi:hypothetical protein
MLQLGISGLMLAEGERRASAAGLANVDWRQADPATAVLDEYDLPTSAFGTMFFGDRVAAFTNMRRTAAPDAHGRSCAGARSPKTRRAVDLPPNDRYETVKSSDRIVGHSPGSDRDRALCSALCQSAVEAS